MGIATAGELSISDGITYSYTRRELFPKGRGILPQQRRHMPSWHFGNHLLLLLIFIYFHCGIVLAKLKEN
jgi:hypothetical protein